MIPVTSIPTRRTILAVLAALCWAAPALAADAPRLSAEQVVAKNVAARGGLAAWRKIRTMSFEGKMDAARPRPEIAGTEDATAHRRMLRPRPGDRIEPASAGNEVPDIALPFRLELKRPLKSRFELDVQGQTAVQVYDGTQGWKLRPYVGKTAPEPFSRDELKDAAAQQALDGMLIDAAAKGNKIALEGTEPIDGHPAYKLKVTLPNGTVRRVWVDSTSFLDVQFDGSRKFDGHTRAVFTAVKDYRNVDGVMVPFVLETRVEGVQHVERIVIDKATANPAIPDARFSRPASGAPASAGSPATARAG